MFLYTSLHHARGRFKVRDRRQPTEEEKEKGIVTVKNDESTALASCQLAFPARVPTALQPFKLSDAVSPILSL